MFQLPSDMDYTNIVLPKHLGIKCCVVEKIEVPVEPFKTLE